MKRYLLPEKGTFYKANLHCHSNISDGTKTPEELKTMFQGQGYSILAYTDHDVFIPHHDLTDDNFLALAGFEVEIYEPGERVNVKGTHLCFLAGDPNTVNQPCWNEKYVNSSRDHIHLVKFDSTLPPFERAHTAERVNAMIKTVREAGFFVTYNHPTWSLDTFEDYSRYKGMHALEIFNTECQNLGYESYVPGVYDDILRGGQRIYAVAADDNHNKRPGDTYGGFVMIKAERLEYKTIMNALFAGEFYASQGPLIQDLYVEDGKIHVTCSDAANIALNSGRRSAQIIHATEGAKINEAVFELREGDPYIRITVTDRFGKHANTRAYFPDEL